MAKVEIKRIASRGTPALLKFLAEVNMAPEEYFDGIYRFDPYSGPSHSLAVLEDGDIVSHVRYMHRPVHGAFVPVITGAVANVGTRVSARGRGYCRDLLNDGRARLRSAGADYGTVLSGVPVYAKSGWEEILRPYARMELDDKQVAAPAGYIVRNYSPDDLSQVRALYNEYCYLRPLCTDRSDQYWRMHQIWAHEDKELFLVAERAGQIVAYMRGNGYGYNQKKYTVSEMVVSPAHPKAADSFLNVLTRYGEKFGCKAVDLNLPPDHPFLTAAGKRFAIEPVLRPHLLIRLVNLEQWLQKQLKVMQNRINGVRVPDFSLEIACEEESLVLCCQNGVFSLAQGAADAPRLSQASLFEVMFGWKSAAENWNLDARGFSAAQRRAIDRAFACPAGVYWDTDGV